MGACVSKGLSEEDKFFDWKLNRAIEQSDDVVCIKKISLFQFHYNICTKKSSEKWSSGDIQPGAYFFHILKFLRYFFIYSSIRAILGSVGG